MKKLIALLLAAVMLFAMAACSAKTEAPAGDTVSEPQTTEADTPAEAQETPAPAEAADVSGSITLMASQNWIKDIDQELFDKFEAETGVEVKVLLTPDMRHCLAQRLRAAAILLICSCIMPAAR